MALTPEEERRVEELLAQAVEEGRRMGRTASLRRVMASAARRVLRADYEAAAAVLEAVGVARALQELASLFLPGSVERWRERMRPTIAGVMEAVEELKEDVLGPFDLEDPVMAEFLDDYVSELAGRLSDTTHRQVMETIREAQGEGLSTPQTARRIRERSGIESPRRAKLIARNELQRTSGGAAWKHSLESGVVKEKIRHEQMDEDTRDSHLPLDGERRPIGEPYSNGEQYAGETDIQCRGWDEFVIDFAALEDPARAAGGGPGGGGDDPPAGGGGAGGGPEDPDDLIRQALDGRELSADEIERLAEHAALAGFYPEPNVRVKGRLAGRVFRGEVLERGALTSSEAQHYFRHVEEREEWPEGTTEDEYLESARRVVRDPASGVYLSRYVPRGDAPVLSFAGRSGEDRGPKGRGWILVEYRPDIGSWATVFQPDAGLGHLTGSEDRRDGKWLRRPDGVSE